MYYELVKNLFDRCLAFIILILTSPILLSLILIIPLTSPGPAIFSQYRIGYKKKKFKIFKLRSMYIDSEVKFPELYKFQYSRLEIETRGIKSHPDPESDPRITPIGKFLRKFSLDELPNLINVLKGDMSIVGPRPELPELIKYYTPSQLKRFSVKPGLTGYPQISGRGLLTQQKTIELDLEYIKNRSMLTDLKIIFKTITVLLSTKGAF